MDFALPCRFRLPPPASCLLASVFRLLPSPSCLLTSSFILIFSPVFSPFAWLAYFAVEIPCFRFSYSSPYITPSAQPVNPPLISTVASARRRPAAPPERQTVSTVSGNVCPKPKAQSPKPKAQRPPVPILSIVKSKSKAQVRARALAHAQNPSGGPVRNRVSPDPIFAFSPKAQSLKPSGSHFVHLSILSKSPAFRSIRFRFKGLNHV